MELFITTDSAWEAKIGQVLDSLYATGFKDFFEKRAYGLSLNGIAVCLMCQSPDLNLKQRVRFVKKEKVLYMDIMLDFNEIIQLDQKQRETIVVKKVVSEVPVIISKYRLEDFDIKKFENDLKKWMYKIL